VFTPYFTDENVEKERGIINQEIRMVEDTPNWEVFVGAYEGLYRNHPVRVSIPGSEESISHITPELLYTCHRAFYSPKNMALVVCGTADFEQVCRMAEEISPQDAPEIGQRHYGERRAEVHQPVVTRKMQVSLPQCMVGFKDEPVPAGESRLRRSLIGDLAVRILCGDTSPLYAKLYEKRLLGRDFDVDYSLIPDGACAILGGESRDPAAVREALERETARLAQEGIEPKLFRRMKNALYGMRLRMLDVPDLYARQEITSVFAGEHYLDFAGLFDTIHAEDVQEMFRRWAQPNRSTMSVVEPK
jgi:predicted Zn-dependent peptidase